MAAFDDFRTLERQLFFPGQRLLAADLDQVVDDHRWRRELHNRACHRAGVGNGFPVTGEIGGREVTIGAGYALDALGHEIISTSTRTEPVPPVVGDPSGGPAAYDLTVRYPEQDELEETETRAGVCASRGVIRRLEEPEFCWVRLEEDAGGELHPIDPDLAQQLQLGHRIRLARVWVADCKLSKLSIAERRNARPPERPYIYCGRTTVEWRIEPFASELLAFTGDLTTLLTTSFQPAATTALFFLTATVDTEAAGFRATPCYSVGLRGERQLLFTVESEGGPQVVAWPADGQPSVEDATPAGFTVRVLPIIPGLGREFARVLGDDFDPTTLQIPWEIEWMGVER